MQKRAKKISTLTKMSSQDIYSGQDVYYFGINFPPGRLFRAGRLFGTLNSEKIFIPGHLFRPGRLLDFRKFPPRTLIQARTSITETRVLTYI